MFDIIRSIRVEVDCHYVRDLLKAGHIEPSYIPTELQPVDLLITKLIFVSRSVCKTYKQVGVVNLFYSPSPFLSMLNAHPLIIQKYFKKSFNNQFLITLFETKIIRDAHNLAQMSSCSHVRHIEAFRMNLSYLSFLIKC